MDEMTNQEQNKMFDKKPEKMVTKKIVCPLCNGTGTFVSPKTGVRAKRSATSLTDSSRACAKCCGAKSIKVKIPESQAKAEKAAKNRENASARAKIDRDAKAAKAALK